MFNVSIHIVAAFFLYLNVAVVVYIEFICFVDIYQAKKTQFGG